MVIRMDQRYRPPGDRDRTAQALVTYLRMARPVVIRAIRPL